MATDDPRRDVVPPRPPPRGQPGAARGRRRRRRAAALRARPRAVGAGRPGPPGLPRRLAARARRVAAPARGVACRWSAAIRYAGWCEAAREVGASRVHVAADYGPYGHRRDREVEKALAEHGIELVRTGSPYAVAPGRVTNGSGDPYKVFTPFSKAWAEHGWRGPVDAPTGRRPGWPSTRPPTSPTRTCPTGSSCPRPARPRPRRRWRDFLDERVGDYDDDRDRPGVDGHLADVGAPQVGRDPPAHDARRPGPAAAAGRGDLPQGAGLAGVLRRRAVPPPRDGAGVPPPRVRADGVRRAGRPARGVARGPHRLPDRGRRACASCGRPAGCTTGCG